MRSLTIRGALAAALAALAGCSGNRPPADKVSSIALPAGGTSLSRHGLPSPSKVGPRLSDAEVRDSIPLADIHSDLSYAVKLDVARDSAGESPAHILRAAVTVRNISSRMVRLEYGACAVSLRAYRGLRNGRGPVWRSEHRAGWPTATAYDCEAILFGITLAPGQSETKPGFGGLNTRVPLPQIYGDSLPAGDYSFSVRLELNGDTTVLSGGHAMLVPSRFVVRPDYPLDGFRYHGEAHEVTAPRQTFDVRVDVTNGGRRGELTRYISRDCPIVLHAYRSADAQRTAPPAPVWISPRSCVPVPDPVRLAPGESRMLTRQVTGPEVLGDSLAPGRYFFTAIVPLIDSRTSRINRRLWLDVGAFELRAPVQSRRVPSRRVAEPRTRSRGRGRS
ncbi:MAG: hypothetical protein WKF55_03105 [Gemmatimonadaceae bacterium]